MCRSQRLLMFAVALFGLSSCQSIPRDVSQLIGTKQAASVWVSEGKSFELKGTPSVHTYASNSTVTVEFEEGGRWVWNSRPAIRIDSESGSARVELSSDLFDHPEKIVPASDTGQNYGIRLFRVLKPTRQWVSKRSDTYPVYTTGIDADGSITQTLSHFDTDYYDDYYMDGYIEYRLGFYDQKSKLVAVIHFKKPVTNFLERSVRT